MAFECRLISYSDTINSLQNKGGHGKDSSINYHRYLLSYFLATGCSSPKVNTYETRTYKSVSPENKLKIEQGIIGVGMSIEECKASCPKCQFFKKFASINGSYELWKVDGAPQKELYLNVVNGRIEKVSESGIQKPQQEKIRQKKNQ